MKKETPLSEKEQSKVLINELKRQKKAKEDLDFYVHWLEMKINTDKLVSEIKKTGEKK